MMNVLHTLMSSNTFSPVADALSTSGSLFQLPSHGQLSSGAAAALASESFRVIPDYLSGAQAQNKLLPFKWPLGQKVTATPGCVQ